MTRGNIPDGEERDKYEKNFRYTVNQAWGEAIKLAAKVLSQDEL